MPPTGYPSETEATAGLTMPRSRKGREKSGKAPRSSEDDVEQTDDPMPCFLLSGPGLRLGFLPLGAVFLALFGIWHELLSPRLGLACPILSPVSWTGEFERCPFLFGLCISGIPPDLVQHFGCWGWSSRGFARQLLQISSYSTGMARRPGRHQPELYVSGLLPDLGPGPDPGAIDHGICHSGLAYHCGLLAKGFWFDRPQGFDRPQRFIGQRGNGLIYHSGLTTGHDGGPGRRQTGQQWRELAVAAKGGSGGGLAFLLFHQRQWAELGKKSGATSPNTQQPMVSAYDQDARRGQQPGNPFMAN
ncbi:hypothetical protein Taro_014992 [Colocasia esculenta]|uniref:Uncharacterized protein n=1 Tax=Colocasia esculenta TaxID=4460 RepID=A0A843UL23_COLES|nr:hypothetical protein [Colocasia esculenta]